VTRLEYLRRLKGLSPERFAGAMNDGKPEGEWVSGRTIRRMESGVEPRAETALRVAQFLDVSPVALLMDVPLEELQGAA
jgi:transcriptional regulator with XRE-family HTH domain